MKKILFFIFLISSVCFSYDSTGGSGKTKTEKITHENIMNYYVKTNPNIVGKTNMYTIYRKKYKNGEYKYATEDNFFTVWETLNEFMLNVKRRGYVMVHEDETLIVRRSE